MGAGNSTLSPEQKANISKSVKDKYELLQADSNLNHEDILRELSRYCFASPYENN
jgi:hypothetical protein